MEYVTSHFGPAVKHEILSIWYDKKLKGGDEFNDEIGVQLNACDLCVLLVSRYSLESKYIMDTEMKRVRERKIRIYPIVVTRTTTSVVKWLDQTLLRPEDGKPLFAFDESARDDEMAKIVIEIVDITSPPMASNSTSPQHSGGAL